MRRCVVRSYHSYLAQVDAGHDPRPLIDRLLGLQPGATAAALNAAWPPPRDVREAYAQRDRLAAALYAGLVEQARVSEDDHGSG